MKIRMKWIKFRKNNLAHLRHIYSFNGFKIQLGTRSGLDILSLHWIAHFNGTLPRCDNQNRYAINHSLTFYRPFHKRLKILYWFIRKISSDSVLSSKNMLTLQVSCWYTQQKCYYSHTHVTVKAFLNLFRTTLASFAWKGLFFNWR